MPSHIDPHEALSRIRTIAGRDTISPLDLLMEIRVMLNIFLPEPHLQLRTGFCCGVSEECKADTPLVHCEDCGGVKPEEPHPTGTGGEQCDACERVARLGDDFYCSKHGKPKEAPRRTMPSRLSISRSVTSTTELRNWKSTGMRSGSFGKRFSAILPCRTSAIPPFETI